MQFTHGDNQPNKYDSIEDKYHVSFVELESGSIQIDELTLTSYPLVHGTCTPCNGYTLKLENKMIGYTGDTTECDNLDTLILESDFIFIDTTLLETNATHIGFSKILEYAKKYENKTFYLMHRSDMIENPNYENVIVPMDEETKNLCF